MKNRSDPWKNALNYCQIWILIKMTLHIPLPVTVIGVIVDEALGAKTGLPVAAADTAKVAANRPNIVT
jgi:hypothetical protein